MTYLEDRWTIKPPMLTTLTGTRVSLPEREERWPGRTLVRDPTLWLLTRASRRPMHQAVERYARYFQREFGYDFALYSAADPADGVPTRAYLWALWEPYDPPQPAVGAVCFRWRTWQNCPLPFWAMQWIWLHPYARRQGLLTQAWPHFCTEMAPLCIEPPLSHAMQGFLQSKVPRPCRTDQGQEIPLYGGVERAELVAPA